MSVFLNATYSFPVFKDLEDEGHGCSIIKDSAYNRN